MKVLSYEGPVASGGWINVLEADINGRTTVASAAIMEYNDLNNDFLRGIRAQLISRMRSY